MTYIPDRRDYKPIRTDEQSQKQFEALETNTTQRALSPQPAPGAEGEWRVVNRDGAVIRIVEAENDTIATVTGDTRAERQRKAARIVSDHTLAASVPKLVEALKSARMYISAGYQPPELMDAIDTALATREK
jgi:hypothetical protein